MASLKVVLLSGAKAKSFSIYSLISVLNELPENTELLPGRSKLSTQSSTSQILAI